MARKSGAGGGGQRETAALLLTGCGSEPGMKWLTPLELLTSFMRRCLNLPYTLGSSVNVPSLPLSFLLGFSLGKMQLDVHNNALISMDENGCQMCWKGLRS